MNHFILGTAGHVDHGKTALIRALTGIDCDTHKEEKERGITINLGFAHLTLPNGDSLGIIDVPGHKDFIRTMVAGAFGMDIVMLVVAADSGIMPQTTEHLRIIEMLGIQKGIIALTKADLVDNEMMELVQLEIHEFLDRTAFQQAPVIPVSAVTGEGLGLLKNTIMEMLSGVTPREQSDHFRLYIDRLFSVKGLGFVATGSVLEGQMETGREVFLLPGKNKKFKVRNIERHGESVRQVIQGDRAALNLAGIKEEDFERGMVLMDKHFEETDLIDTVFTLFEDNEPLGPWTTAEFLSGTYESAVRMHLLDQNTLRPGERGLFQIHLSRPAILFNKDKYIVRNSSNEITLGGGLIIDAKPLHHRKRTDALVQSLSDLAEAILHPHKLVHLIKIELRKVNQPAFAEEIASRIQKKDEEIIVACKGEESEGISLFQVSGRNILVLTVMHQSIREKILGEISAWHQKNPILPEGLEIPEISGKLGYTGNEALKIYLPFVLNGLQEEGLLKKEGNSWALTGHQVVIDQRSREQLDWLEKVILEFGMEKPVEAEVEELAKAEKISKDRLKMMLKYLGRQNKLVFFEGEYIHHKVVDQCRILLLNELKDKEKGINEKDFRLLINGTKKMVQILENIFLEEAIISKRTFYIDITEKGKEIIQSYKS